MINFENVEALRERERERERELTFNEINNKFNIDRKLKDSDKSLRN